MACLHPKYVPNPCFHQVKSKSGAPVPLRISQQRYLTVPCCRCVNCLSLRQNTWAWRIEQDAFDVMKKDGCVYFITITYDDNHLIYGIDDVPTLYKKDLQDFHKRLRRSGLSFRYFDCGEYGDKFSRPHYHGIYFFEKWMTKEKVHDLFFDKWRKCEEFELHVDSFSLASAKYVAKYSMKRFGVNYQGVEPPFSLVSINPPIGFSFFDNKFELKRLRDQMSFTVYDSSGNPNMLPRLFRDKIFTRLEQDSIMNRIQDEKYHLDKLFCQSNDPLDIARFQESSYISQVLGEERKVKERCLKDFGKDCKVDYMSYMDSI